MSTQPWAHAFGVVTKRADRVAKATMETRKTVGMTDLPTPMDVESSVESIIEQQARQ
jgi:hypothetical protein